MCGCFNTVKAISLCLLFIRGRPICSPSLCSYAADTIWSLKWRRKPALVNWNGDFENFGLDAIYMEAISTNFSKWHLNGNTCSSPQAALSIKAKGSGDQHPPRMRPPRKQVLPVAEYHTPVIAAD